MFITNGVSNRWIVEGSRANLRYPFEELYPDLGSTLNSESLANSARVNPAVAGRERLDAVWLTKKRNRQQPRPWWDRRAHCRERLSMKVPYEPPRGERLQTPFERALRAWPSGCAAELAAGEEWGTCPALFAPAMACQLEISDRRRPSCDISECGTH